MASTAEASIADLRQESEALLTYVTGPETRARTADEVERALFRRLLALGAALLQLFFLTRAAERPRGPVTSPDGAPLASHDRRPTTDLSAFGRLTFRRQAFTAPGQPVGCPLDAALGLPPRRYSDLLREWASYAATDAAFREAPALLARILGRRLSTQALATVTRDDAHDVAAFYARPPAAARPTALGAIPVAQAAGKGVPLVLPPRAERPVRRGKGHPADRKREAVVTALYAIAPDPRTPEEVVAALLPEGERPPPAPRPRPVGKELRATLDGKDAALSRLAQRVAQREGPAIRHRVALTDGAEALPQRVAARLPGFTLVLDIIHAAEYLWDAANAVLGEAHPARTAWVRRHLRLLLAGRTAAVIAAPTKAAAGSRLSKTRRRAVERTIGHYARNAPFMRYDTYLDRGWPIGTGVAEGACGHLVKDRMEQAGMRWTKEGAQAVLDLRAVRPTDDWDAYWARHRQQQHRRCYGAAAPAPAPSEALSLELPTAA